MLPTLRIQGECSEGNPDGVVVINRSDYDPSIHTALEPVEDLPAGDAGTATITGAQLEEAHAEMQRRFEQFNAERARLEGIDAAQKIEAQRLAELAAANEAEAKRLAELAATLAAGAPSAGEMTATQLKDALTALNVEFKGNASKAELQALYDANKPAN